jgi:hypothetical protein
VGDQLGNGFHTSAMSDETCCPVVELRQYTLVPGGREVLISLFEEHFIESQEATGMIIIGQFRELNNPDRFVWLRGFADMASRARQLQEFYGGPVWKKHRHAANATMIDSDNVLLLRPARTNSRFCLENLERPPHASTEESNVLIAVTIYYVAGSADSFIEFFDGELVPKLTNARASILATFITENHPNTFPALPVREGENVFVSFSRFANCESYEQHASSFADPTDGQFARIKASETLLLTPTARSLLR